MQEQNVVIHRDLRDAAIDRTTNRLTGPAEIEENSRRARPRFGAAFQILLHVEVLMEKVPLPLITRSLQQLDLMKPRQHGIVSGERGFERVLHPTGSISKDLDPDR